MEAAAAAAAAGAGGLRSLGTIATSSSHLRHSAAAASDCCGLAGSSLSNFSLSSSSGARPRSRCLAVAMLGDEFAFPRLDEAEAEALVAECADMDWKRLVEELHSEAMKSLGSAQALDLKALEREMGGWIHDRMAEGIETPLGGASSFADDGWSCDSAAHDLRMQASLQVSQQLAMAAAELDWEHEASLLHQSVEPELLQAWGRSQSEKTVEPEWFDEGVIEPELVQAWFRSQSEVAVEPELLQLWFRSHIEVADSSKRLASEAIASEAISFQSSSLPESETEAEVKVASWFGIGYAALMASLWVRGASVVDAV